MSRGLGKIQLEIKRILQAAYDKELGAVPFATIRGVFIEQGGGNPETDKLWPNFERSLKRSLKTLVDCGDVLIVSGKGGQRSPFAYTTVEAFTQEPDTDKAKIELRELADAAALFQKSMTGDI